MNKSKIFKMSVISLIFIITLCNFTVKLYALTTPKDDPDKFFETFEPGLGGSEADLKSRIEKVLETINIVGIIISVITLMVIGIKYMIGSIDEKAEYKKTAIMYLVGAAIVFSTTTIPNILYKFASNINIK